MTENGRAKARLINARGNTPEIPDKIPVTRSRAKALLRLARKWMRKDFARISCPGGEKMFLIVGDVKNTKDGSGQWYNQDGEKLDWDYIDEHVVASGCNTKELISDMRKYKRLNALSLFGRREEPGPWHMNEIYKAVNDYLLRNKLEKAFLEA